MLNHVQINKGQKTYPEMSEEGEANKEHCGECQTEILDSFENNHGVLLVKDEAIKKRIRVAEILRPELQRGEGVA